MSINTSGLACPMPVVNTKKAIQKLQPGQVLEVIATDNTSRSDIPVLLKKLGHELLSMKEENGVITFLIRKN
ncbi:MAG: sulfurtransferase TusA family protein [Alphaproteobacteria bacterium]|uniref:Sulfurtransferase TusA family protein n=1 Tax=Candidatus Nitrobium versatile TaxID=2884831 RepID=A0A953J7I0_9BACT|nr:sulfurtransferase TusA family protein [Candidatus Nitrobium versatile]